MLGDVLLITEKHKRAAQTIFKRVLKEQTDKYIVAISGESGSGKTELSHSLAKLLKQEGIRTKLLHTDNYYITPPNERTEWRKKHEVSEMGYTEYNWDLINQNIQDFKENRRTTMPCIDIITDSVDMLTTDFSTIDILVIDGLYAIKTKGVNLRVFIDLTYHETKMAQINRGKEPLNEFRQMVLEREHVVVQSLKPTADLLVNRYYEVVDATKKIIEDYEKADKTLLYEIDIIKSKLSEAHIKEFENTQKTWEDFRETNAKMFAEFANLKTKSKASYYYFLYLMTLERINNLRRTVL